MSDMIGDNITYTEEENDGAQGKISQLKKKLKACQKEKEEYLAQAQRARADLINYRNRQERLFEEFKLFNQENLLRELLMVLDSLDAGLKETKKIKPIREQLIKILEKYGVKEIKTIGEKFNPHFHEAIDIIEAEGKEGVVVEETQRGYLLGEKVLRASKVRVGR